MKIHAQSLSVTLTPSNYNGYNISCFGAQDGSISANPSDGTLPYTYAWSNQETGQTINDLAAGYYRAEVKDATGTIVYGEVTLTEPEALQLEPVINTYGNGYNISCYNCFNGSITLTISGGISPYTHLWSDGAINKNRWNLGPGNHTVVVTDANGCEVNSETMYLNQPERSDWTMTGNSGSNPATNFIDTTYSVRVSLRTNNAEWIKIKANGDVKVSSLKGNGYSLLYADSNGVLQKPDPDGGTFGVALPWMTNGNDNITTTDYIGTHNSAPLIFKTDVKNFGGERMRITADGKVGIGTSNPQQQMEIVHSNSGFTKGGINLNANFACANAHSEIRFMKGTDEKWAIGNDLDADGNQNFFIWNDDAGTIPFFINGAANSDKIGIGTVNPECLLHLSNYTYNYTPKLMLESFNSSQPVIAFKNNDGVNSSGFQMKMQPDGDFEMYSTYGNVSGTDPCLAFAYNQSKVFVGMSSCITAADCNNADYKLYVGGSIAARELKVTQNNYPDYVFEKDYKLISIEE